MNHPFLSNKQPKCAAQQGATRFQFLSNKERKYAAQRNGTGKQYDFQKKKTRAAIVWTCKSLWGRHPVRQAVPFPRIEGRNRSRLIGELLEQCTATLERLDEGVDEVPK